MHINSAVAVLLFVVAVLAVAVIYLVAMVDRVTKRCADIETYLGVKPVDRRLARAQRKAARRAARSEVRASEVIGREITAHPDEVVLGAELPAPVELTDDVAIELDMLAENDQAVRTADAVADLLAAVELDDAADDAAADAADVGASPVEEDDEVSGEELELAGDEPAVDAADVEALSDDELIALLERDGAARDILDAAIAVLAARADARSGVDDVPGDNPAVETVEEPKVSWLARRREAKAAGAAKRAADQEWIAARKVEHAARRTAAKEAAAVYRAENEAAVAEAEQRREVEEAIAKTIAAERNAGEVSQREQRANERAAAKRARAAHKQAAGDARAAAKLSAAQERNAAREAAAAAKVAKRQAQQDAKAARDAERAAVKEAKAHAAQAKRDARAAAKLMSDSPAVDGDLVELDDTIVAHDDNLVGVLDDIEHTDAAEDGPLPWEQNNATLEADEPETAQQTDAGAQVDERGEFGDAFIDEAPTNWDQTDATLAADETDIVEPVTNLFAVSNDDVAEHVESPAAGEPGDDTLSFDVYADENATGDAAADDVAVDDFDDVVDAEALRKQAEQAAREEEKAAAAARKTAEREARAAQKAAARAAKEAAARRKAEDREAERREKQQRREMRATEAGRRADEKREARLEKQAERRRAASLRRARKLGMLPDEKDQPVSAHLLANPDVDSDGHAWSVEAGFEGGDRSDRLFDWQEAGLPEPLPERLHIR